MGRSSRRPGGALGEPGQRSKGGVGARATHRQAGGRAPCRSAPSAPRTPPGARGRRWPGPSCPRSRCTGARGRRRSVNQARLQSLCRAVRVPQRCLQATSTLPRPGGALAGKTPRMGPPAGAPHLVAVHVEAVGPADVVEDDGLPADRLERAHRRVDAARQQRQRLLEHLRALPAAATPVASSSSPRELGRKRATRLTGRRDARQASMRAGPSTRSLGRRAGRAPPRTGTCSAASLQAQAARTRPGRPRRAGPARAATAGGPPRARPRGTCVRPCCCVTHDLRNACGDGYALFRIAACMQQLTCATASGPYIVCT